MLFSKKLYFSFQMLFFLLFIQKTLKTEYIISTVYILVFIKKFFFYYFELFKKFYTVWIIFLIVKTFF